MALKQQKPQQPLWNQRLMVDFRRRSGICGSECGQRCSRNRSKRCRVMQVRFQQAWTGASSAIDIFSSIDTSSMDEATAAAVNSAVQSAIGAISGGVATAQGGVASLQAHAGQVSGLSDQAAQVQAAADCDKCTECTDCSTVGEAAAQLQDGLSQMGRC